MSGTDVKVAWIEIYGFNASKYVKCYKQEIFYTAKLLLRNGYKQEMQKCRIAL
jgi:hypothetical protein